MRLMPVICAVAFMLIIACVPEEEQFTFDSSASLRFSSDSVTFDTVFTSLGSVTKRLKVYNDSKNAVRISQISLAAGASPYTLTVNGTPGNRFEDVRLLGGDSLLVLVEVLVDPADEDMPFLVTDELQFITNGNEQEVTLVSYGQDAIFLNGAILECDAVWTANRPYLIYNSVLVKEGCTLTVEPGTRIYSHNASYVFIEGSLRVEGSTEDNVIFTNDRFDEFFLNAPGQWGGILLLEKSGPHAIDHAIIKNAQVGIYMGIPDNDDDPDLILSNSIIENMGGSDILPDGDFQIIPGFGILAFNSDIEAYNVLINNCQERLVGNFAGGSYRYSHCTFGNYSFTFFRQQPALLFADNALLGDDILLEFPIKLRMQNTILWGSLADELQISLTEPEVSSLLIENNLLRTLEFEIALEENNLINTNPLFFDPENANYQLQENSPVIDAGSDIGIPLDLPGRMRDASPDYGAYEYIQ